MITRVKICGITNRDDALAACAAGADAVGFVFAKSTRQVEAATVRSIIQALPPFVTAVGVFVNEAIETVRSLVRYCSLDVVQLHGDEDVTYVRELDLPCVKTFRVADESVVADIKAFGCSVFLLDTYDPKSSGGTGRTFDWKRAAQTRELGKVILAGGLTPDNVTRALSEVHPYAVDVSSGVEGASGNKDREKMKRFVSEVRKWDFRINSVTSENSAGDLYPKR